MDNLSRENLNYLLNNKLKPFVDGKLHKKNGIILDNNALFISSGNPQSSDDVILNSQRYAEIRPNSILLAEAYDDGSGDYKVAYFDFEKLREIQSFFNGGFEYDFKVLNKWKHGFATNWFMYFNGGEEMLFDYYNILEVSPGEWKHTKFSITSVTPVSMGDQDPTNVDKAIKFYRDVERNAWYVKPVDPNVIYGYYDVSYTMEELYEEDDEWEDEWIAWWDDYNAGIIVR